MIFHARVVLQHLDSTEHIPLSTVEEVVMAATEDEAEAKAVALFAKPDVLVASVTLKKVVT